MLEKNYSDSIDFFIDFIKPPAANSENAITSDTQVGKISHVAPIYPNQDLVVLPDRGSHPLSGDF